MPLPSISPVQSDVLTSLRNFLLFVLPQGTECIRGQDNRVASPIGPDYVVMTPILMNRLETNVDLYADCAFVGSISGNTLSVTQMLHGNITVGNQVFGSGVSSGIFVSGTLSGTGGIRTYALSGSLGAIPSETMACGVLFAMQPTEWTVQLDVYGPNSPNNAQIISTLFRDDFAIQNFIDSDRAAPPNWVDVPPGGTISVPYDGVRPLYADDPRQMTPVFGEMQFEIRWTIDACLQANMIVTAPQQFMASVRINPIEVEATFPP